MSTSKTSITSSADNPPLCNLDPSHGPMQIEPMYGDQALTIILQHGWFCQVKGCEGYGGPAKQIKATHKTDEVKAIYQLDLFGKENK